MKLSMKGNISQSLAKNKKLNQKALQMKKSWDEVSGILNGKGKKKK